MPLIERINQMKKEGLNQNQISQRLQEEGVTPKEINEAMEQSNVKAAVGTEKTGNMQGMQPSVMTPNTEEVPQAPVPSSLTQSPPAIPSPKTQPRQPLQEPPQTQPTPQAYPEQSYPQQFQEPYPTEEVPQAMMPEAPEPGMSGWNEPTTQELGGGYYQDYQQPAQYAPYAQYQYPEYGQDTDMAAEIAEQVVSEKFEKISKQLSEAIRLKTEMDGRISSIDERLKRIEIIIDRLQASIINKIGDYGKNISDLKDEMILTQESFSKVLKPLKSKTEKTSTERKKTTKKRTTKKRGRKRKGNFEKYLRK